MTEVTAYILVAVGFSVVLLWLMRPRPNPPKRERLPLDQSFENFIPRHYRFFPQVRQALSAGDHEYLCESAPPHVVKRVMQERREVARRYLAGLREDFSKLERLGRVVAALSPVISREQETERLLLSLKFRVLYSLVFLRIAAGPVPIDQIDLLTGLVGRLAVRMEQAIAQINALSEQRLPTGLNA